MPETRKLQPLADWVEVSATPEDWDRIGLAEAIRMHDRLHLVRAFEESVLEMERQGLIHGPAHSSIGQEGGAIGSIMPLRAGDQVTGSHRGHHQFLVKALIVVDAAGDDPLTSAFKRP